jgi:hypothetical protein
MAWPPYAKALKEAGVYVSGAGLDPPEFATTVKLRDGRRLLQDGPMEADEQQRRRGD